LSWVRLVDVMYRTGPNEQPSAAAELRLPGEDQAWASADDAGDPGPLPGINGRPRTKPALPGVPAHSPAIAIAAARVGKAPRSRPWRPPLRDWASSRFSSP
jgi:hypothetical protein